MVLCFVEVVSGGYAMGRQCITSVCASFSTYYCLKMCDFTSMIFTVPLWGSEVANSKTEIHLTNTAVEVGMQSSYICDVTTSLIYSSCTQITKNVSRVSYIYMHFFVLKNCQGWLFSR